VRLPAFCVLALTLPTAWAQPELRELEVKWETEAARKDYVFLWDIDSDTIGRGDPYRNYRTIYDGLMYALTESRRWVEPGTPTAVKLERVARVPGWDESYVGQISTRETYLSGEPVILHAEVLRRDCDKDRVQVLYTISLSPPDSDGWKEMRQARNELKCRK
jgi:hypothetical protein